MTTWLYQMSHAKWLYPKDWGKQDPVSHYRRAIGRRGVVGWWTVGLKKRASPKDPELPATKPGDRLVPAFVPTTIGSDGQKIQNPGIYGVGSIVEVAVSKGREDKIKWKILTPTQKLAADPIPWKRCQDLLKRIRGGSAQGTLFRVDPPVWLELRKRIKRWSHREVAEGSKRGVKKERGLAREESQAHKNLKAYVQIHSEDLLGRGVMPRWEEFPFLTGDKADLVLEAPHGRYWTVEVKVDIGREDLAGLLQAVKYQVMFAVGRGLLKHQVMAALVARSIHPHMEDLCRRYGVRPLSLGPIA